MRLYSKPSWIYNGTQGIRVTLLIVPGGGFFMSEMPVVYTIKGCDACVKLLNKWNADGVEYEERIADSSQEMMEEARKHGNVVPIVVYPDGRIEEGFEGGIGCYIG